MKEVPVINIGQDRHAVAKLINEACIKWGFFLITGHGVPNQLIDRMFSVSYDFFDLSEEEKLQYRRRTFVCSFWRFLQYQQTQRTS